MFSFFAVPILLGDITIDFMKMVDVMVDVMVMVTGTGTGSGNGNNNNNNNNNNGGEGRAQTDWAYEFPDRTEPDTQICRTGLNPDLSLEIFYQIKYLNKKKI